VVRIWPLISSDMARSTEIIMGLSSHVFHKFFVSMIHFILGKISYLRSTSTLHRCPY
jgi:hypothetical protein